jgi:general secretion pathway protein G
MWTRHQKAQMSLMYIPLVPKKLLMARPITPGEPMTENQKKYMIRPKGLTKSQSLSNPLQKISRGFTLIELMVVMTVIALLISIAVPRYFNSLEKAKEATLKQSLSVMRVAIDKFYGDNERYPISIAELVTKKYIRAVPVDPITESTETWITQPPNLDTSNAVFDIKSGAPGSASDGTEYVDW